MQLGFLGGGGGFGDFGDFDLDGEKELILVISSLVGDFDVDGLGGGGGG